MLIDELFPLLIASAPSLVTRLLLFQVADCLTVKIYKEMEKLLNTRNSQLQNNYDLSEPQRKLGLKSFELLKFTLTQRKPLTLQITY